MKSQKWWKFWFWGGKCNFWGERGWNTSNSEWLLLSFPRRAHGILLFTPKHLKYWKFSETAKTHAPVVLYHLCLPSPTLCLESKAMWTCYVIYGHWPTNECVQRLHSVFVTFFKRLLCPQPIGKLWESLGNAYGPCNAMYFSVFILSCVCFNVFDVLMC